MIDIKKQKQKQVDGERMRGVFENGMTFYGQDEPLFRSSNQR